MIRFDRLSRQKFVITAVSFLTAVFICYAHAFALSASPILLPPLLSFDNSSFVSQNVPQAMEPGKKYQIAVTFKNIGRTIWTYDQHMLVSQNPFGNNIWSVRMVNLQVSESIKPGQNKTFVFEVTAPLKPGTYNFQWQMFRKKGWRLGFFGQRSINLRITVKPNSPPQITSITPQDGSQFLSGPKIDIKAAAYDPDGNTLEYQFSIRGSVVRAWAPLNSYLSQTDIFDTGSLSVLCEVRDNLGGFAQGTVIYTLHNPTPEQIFQRVKDNAALVQDKVAFVNMTSTLNAKPFGDAIYTTQYFKTPDKERTDDFSTIERTQKTKTIITTGPLIYFINPGTKSVQQMNLAEQMQVDQSRLDAMNELEDISVFLDNHNVTIDRVNSDFTRGLIMVELIPTAAFPAYSKLRLLIDYFKGVEVSNAIYRVDKKSGQEKLKQMIEIGETQNIDGAWVGTKMTKTSYLGTNVFRSDLILSEIKVNQGISDSVFDPYSQ